MCLPVEINIAAATRITHVCTFVLKGSVNFLYFLCFQAAKNTKAQVKDAWALKVCAGLSTDKPYKVNCFIK